MTFDEYQDNALKTDVYKDVTDKDIRSDAFYEKLLGLIGETGEVAEKFKKIYRDNKGELTQEQLDLMKKELGDIMWYIASLSAYLGFDLQEVADVNLEKLASRQQRNKLHGSGDNR